MARSACLSTTRAPSVRAERAEASSAGDVWGEFHEFQRSWRGRLAAREVKSHATEADFESGAICDADVIADEAADVYADCADAKLEVVGGYEQNILWYDRAARAALRRGVGAVLAGIRELEQERPRRWISAGVPRGTAAKARRHDFETAWRGSRHTLGPLPAETLDTGPRPRRRTRGGIKCTACAAGPASHKLGDVLAFVSGGCCAVGDILLAPDGVKTEDAAAHAAASGA